MDDAESSPSVAPAEPTPAAAAAAAPAPAPAAPAAAATKQTQLPRAVDPKQWQLPRGVDLPHEAARRWGLAGKESWQDGALGGDLMQMFTAPATSKHSPVKQTGVHSKGRALTQAEKQAKTRLLPTMLWAEYGHNAVPVLPLLSGPDIFNPATHGIPATLFLCVRVASGTCDFKHRVGDLSKADAEFVINNLREKCVSHVCRAHPYQGSMLHSALQTFPAMDWSLPTFDMMSTFLKNAAGLTVSLLLLPPAPVDVETALSNVLAWAGKDSKGYDTSVPLDKQLDRRKAEFQSSSKPRFSTGGISDDRDKMLKSRNAMVNALSYTACAWLKTSLRNNTFGKQIKALLDTVPRPKKDAGPLSSSAAKPSDPLDDDEEEPLMKAPPPPPPPKGLTQAKLSGGKRSANEEIRVPPKKKKKPREGVENFIDGAASENDGDDDDEEEEDADEACSDAADLINDECDSQGNPIDSYDEDDDDGEGEPMPGKRRPRLRRGDGSHVELHAQWSMSKASEQVKKRSTNKRVRDSESESEDEDEDEDEDEEEDELSGEEGEDGEEEEEEENGEEEDAGEDSDDESVASADDASACSDEEDAKERKRFAAHKKEEREKKKNKKKKQKTAQAGKSKALGKMPVKPANAPVLRVTPCDTVLPEQFPMQKTMKVTSLTSKSLEAATAMHAKPVQKSSEKAPAPPPAPSERSAASSSDRPVGLAARQYLEQQQRQQRLLGEQQQQQQQQQQLTAVAAPPPGQQRPHAFNRRKPIHEACVAAVETQQRWVGLALDKSPASGPLVLAPMLISRFDQGLTDAQASMTNFANTGKIEHAEEALKASFQLISLQRDVIQALSTSQPAPSHGELAAATRELSLAAGSLIERVIPGLQSFTSTLTQCAKLGNSLNERSQDMCVALVESMQKVCNAHAVASGARQSGIAASSSSAAANGH